MNSAGGPGRGPGRALPEVRFRRPTEADYPAVALVVDEWWDGRVVEGLLPRLWFRHFSGTSWLAEADEPGGSRSTGHLVGFLAGFLSQHYPEVGVIQAMGVHPSYRRLGIGRALVDRFTADARSAGRTTVEAVAWPGSQRAARFMESLGFRPDTGSGTHPLYGRPAIAGYDFGTEDRIRFSKEVGTP